MAETKTIRARVTGLRISPRKVGLVASLVRGRTVSDALVILQHTPKRAARPLVKLINSAKANAVTGASLNEQSLVVSQLQVTSGPRLKRYNPAAMGRALPYLKRSSHVLIEVSGEVKAKKPTAKEATAPSGAKKETK